MARYTGPVCKLCRRERTKLFLKGQRCESSKCAIELRPYPPGEHGRGRIKETQYLIQLREKQKARRIYGVLERQFRKTVKEAERARGITGEMLLALLERRLDNVVHRLGFASSRSEGRQLVRHGHFSVNGRRMSIPSARVKKGDLVGLTERGKKAARIEGSLQTVDARAMPAWLSLDIDKKEGEIIGEPAREEITLPIQEQLIVELYSR
jgi:small subunit ribosomal protein S4